MSCHHVAGGVISEANSGIVIRGLVVPDLPIYTSEDLSVSIYIYTYVDRWKIKPKNINISVLQKHIHAHTHTYIYIYIHIPHTSRPPGSPSPDGQPCGSVPCAEVRGWDVGMSQFSEMEWALLWDLSLCSRFFVQDVKSGLLISLAK